MKRTKTTLPFLSAEIWSMILSECDPKTLVACKSACSLFYNVLTSRTVWAASRDKTFAPGCPPPPPDMTDPQYAELTQGQGCQEPVCEDTKSRKIYWAFQMRLCTSCYRKRFCPYMEIEDNLLKYPGLRYCLIQHRWERGKRYKDISTHLDGRPIAFDRLAVQALTEKFAKVKGRVNAEWYREHTTWVTKMEKALEICERFFHNVEKEKRKDKKELAKYLVERAAELIPPLAADELRACASFRRVVARTQGISPRAVWAKVQHQIQIERSDLCQDDSSDKNIGDMDEMDETDNMNEMDKVDDKDDKGEMDNIDDMDDKDDEDDMEEDIRMMDKYDDELRMAKTAAEGPNIGTSMTGDAPMEEGVEVSGMDVGASETNGGIARVPWPASVAFPFHAPHLAHPHHHQQ
ncbi:hypothetical protein MMC32_003547 [Xylographa parallela]|nr:hypothetical protein [Xylographa parallela]